MDDDEQLLLFGAPRGRVLSGHVAVERPMNGNGWVIRLTFVDEMRQAPMRVDAFLKDGQELAPILGRAVQILEKMYWVDGTNIWNRLRRYVRYLRLIECGYDHSGIGKVDN